jgi:hypothetical protein
VSSAETISIAALAAAMVGGGSSAYAVVISRRALHLEERRDLERAEPRVSISFGHASAFRFGDGADEDKLYYALTINIINEGQSPEFVKTLWVEPATGGEGVDYSPKSDVELKPRSRWPVPIDAADIPRADEGFVAIAYLASGQEARSAVEHLIDGMLDADDD